MKITEAVFLTIKWGDEFCAADVNILKRAAKHHCQIPSRFICLTDNPAGLDDDIVAQDIPIEGLEQFPRSSQGWGKICLFHPSLSTLFEDALFIDIDTVVVGALDPFFRSPPHPMRMLAAGRRWRDKNDSLLAVPATGVFRYRPADNEHIFRAFQSDPEGAYSHFTLEQEFVAHHAKSKEYFPVTWIESFKYHLRRDFLVDLLLPPKAPRPDTRLVAFHGFPRPREVATPGVKWARFPRSGLHRPKWLLEYWQRFS